MSRRRASRSQRSRDRVESAAETVLRSQSRIAIAAISAVLLLVLSVMVGYNVWATTRTQSIPALVDLTARQRTLAERYVKDVVLHVEGQGADPDQSMSLLRSTAATLLSGGPVAQAGSDVPIIVPAARGTNLRKKLVAIKGLIGDLNAAGDELLATPAWSSTFESKLLHLRVLGALVSSSTADASNELSRDAEGRLKGLVEIEIVLGLLGASTALTMGLVLRHAATRQSALFRSLVRGSADMIFLTARDGRVRYASPALLTVLGRPPSTLLGRSLDDIIDTRRSDNTQRWFRGTPPPDGPLEPLTVVFIHQDGSLRDIELDATARFTDRNIRGMVINARDVTERRRADDQLRATLARTHAIVETAAEGILTISDRGRIESFNRAAELIFGYDSADVIGQPAALLFADLTSAPSLGEGGSQAAQGTWEGECARHDGSSFHAEMAISSVQLGHRLTHTAIIRDTSERDALQQRLTHQALHDQLTGLANRTQLLERVAHGLMRADRDDALVAVLFLDLDRFKVVNDGLGHNAGDQLLIETARRLKELSRSADTVARLGGDEFVILYESLADVNDAVHIARRILELVSEPYGLDEGEAFVSASVGIAFASVGDTADNLLRKADVAMYRAKEAGRNRYEIFDHEMQAWADKRLAVENALRYAIDRDELRIHYQPTVDVRTGEIRGSEALVRWQRGDDLVGPEEFIEIAEDTGLINTIGGWVLAQACRDTAAWQARHPDAEPLEVAVNLSGRQLAQPDFVGSVAAELALSGVAPSSVVFEVTESVLLANTEAALLTLRRLKALGIRIAIDDFGTGYSSLSYLRRFPVDLVKIDRSFVEQLGTDDQSATIVEAIIGLAHALDLAVVAEGVETAEHLAELAALGCDFAQGFYFREAIPKAEFEEFLDAELSRTP